MAGSTLGTNFRITTWGESHGKALGVVIDGCPAGIPLQKSDIQKQLDRRKPGQSKFTTPRKEDDSVEILSGVFEGVTTGCPISLMIQNTSQLSKDYSDISDIYRPGHADYTFDQKYGIRDYRGGGRSSGRETVGRVCAGAIAIKLLECIGITFTTYTKAIGPITINPNSIDYNIINTTKTYMPDLEAAKQAEEYLEKCMQEHDSVGGVVECIVSNLPVGLGSPVFDKLDANLAKAILSIGAVKAFEIGDGFASSTSLGSTNNDSFLQSNGQIKKASNHSGGVLGGISDEIGRAHV